MSAREELMKLVWLAGSFESSEIEIGEATDAILAAGYRKPRTITTAKELGDLGRNAAVLAANGAVLVNDGEDTIPWASFAEDPQGGPVWIDSLDVPLPVTVLQEGGAA